MTFEEWWETTLIRKDDQTFKCIAWCAWTAAKKDEEQGKQLIGAHGSLMDRLESQAEGAD